MYSGCDTLSLQILFVYFSALSSLLHPSILIVFYTCYPFLSMILHTVQFSYYDNIMKRGMYITYSTTHLIVSHHTVIFMTLPRIFFHFRVKIGKNNNSINMIIQVFLEW